MTPLRRRHKRRHLIYYLDVFEGDSDRLLGHLGDLTTEGLLLIDVEPLTLGQELDLRVVMPEVPGLSGALRTRATVRWLGKDKNPSIACAGCSFDPLSTDAQATLDLLCRLIGFEDVET